MEEYDANSFSTLSFVVSCDGFNELALIFLVQLKVDVNILIILLRGKIKGKLEKNRTNLTIYY